MVIQKVNIIEISVFLLNFNEKNCFNYLNVIKKLILRYVL